MLDKSLPIELTHAGEIISEDGRRWKAGKYAVGVVPDRFAVSHLGRNLDPGITHNYTEPPVLGEKQKAPEPELKLEAKVEDKPAAKVAQPAAAIPAPPAA